MFEIRYSFSLLSKGIELSLSCSRLAVSGLIEGFQRISVGLPN